MAECEQQAQNVEEEVDEGKPVYKPPAEKSIKEIMQTDQDDESLQKYKEQLLGGKADETEFWPGQPNVILRKMTVLIEGRDDKLIEINLEDQSQLKNMKFPIKEGSKYRIMITFNVQREIVSGLRFSNKIGRGPMSTKEDYMVGSYGPRKEEYEYKSPVDEFPSGLLGRGEYKVKSLFTDDDKNEILSWEWIIDIKKDWKD